MKFYRQPEMYAKFLDVLNVIFTVFFTMEFVFKLGAFRFKVTDYKRKKKHFYYCFQSHNYPIQCVMNIKLESHSFWTFHEE